MDFIPNEWLVFWLRWVHVTAGIMWIGNSFYFMWLDANLRKATNKDPSVEGELWMVHSGGFYQVQRKKVGPASMPEVLHWFKWEATITVLSGLLLLALVYYSANAAFLIDSSVYDLSPQLAVLISAASLVIGWFVYDLIWQSKLADSAYAGHIVSVLFLLVAMYFFTSVFSGRGAFIQSGALIGTLMVLNVWVRILPGQSKMIAATERGEEPDFSHGKRAKKRSIHNSYMTLPLLFMMLSNHMPQAYGHPDRFLMLCLLCLLGMGARHAMIAHDRQSFRVIQTGYFLIPALLILLLTRFPLSDLFASPSGEQENRLALLSDAEAMVIINQRCVSCHAENPADNTFGPSPGGISFDTVDSVTRHAARVKLMSVDTQAMPLANKTNMTAEERRMLGRWLEAKGY